VEKLSDYQLRFTTNDVSGPFIYNLTLPILPKNVWAKIDAQKFLLSSLNLNPVGSGPFAVKEVSSQKNGSIQQILLQSFSNFHLGKPKLDNVSVRFYDSDESLMEGLRAKEIQGFGYIATGNEEFAAPSGIQKLTAPLPQYQMVFFNLNNKILAEQNFRQALGQSIDQKRLLAEILKNGAILPSLPLLTENGQNFRPSLPEYNLENAKQTLEKSGWILDPNTNLRTKKGVEAKLTLATNDSPANARTAQYLADSWKEIGVKIDLQILPTRQVTEELIKPRKFDILLFPQKLGVEPDPFVLWHSSQIKNPGINLTGFENQQADKLINEGRNTTNQKLRDEKYLQFYALLNEKLPALFLSQAQYVYLISEEIKNITLKTIYEPSMRFYDAPNWYTETKRVWK
jgi:peptide/nickel transport system substrate-binding protein